MNKKKPKKLGTQKQTAVDEHYDATLSELIGLVESSRRAAARAVNTLMTQTYWLVGKRIVEHEQHGSVRADYGGEVLDRLATDLSSRFGRGFSVRNLRQMRAFYVEWPIRQTVSAELTVPALALPWSHYVRLLSISNAEARSFYETEALRGGWSVRQLERQIDTQFYERTALSKNKRKLLTDGAKSEPTDALSAEDEVKDPFVLEFLNLRDEYSESDLEAALIGSLETFLMELGSDFAFVGRQRRLRVGDAWYRVDLLLFHRALRCLIVVDLKLGKFTHAEAGQMHLYLNYAREHWMLPGENPPVGLILCAGKDAAVAKYALEGLTNKVLAAEYQTKLPDEKRLADEITKTRQLLEARNANAVLERVAARYSRCREI